MLRVLPRLTSEAPREYVEFVARHLDSLRRDARDIVDQDVDSFCTDVLTDVASRWGWLELLRTRLGRYRAGESYLRSALQRRAQRWTVEEGDAMPVYVWSEDAPARSPFRSAGPSAPRRSSVALRRAPLVRPDPRHEVVPVIEAAIAWLHAMEGHRRRRFVALAALLFGFVALIARLNQQLAA